MKRLTLLFVALMVFIVAMPVSARQEAPDTESIKTEAVRAFEKILDLWHAGDYDHLYDRTTVAGKDTRESFRKKMEAAKLKPSCCWEKMQDVVVSVKSNNSVMIRARIGMDAPGAMEYKTKSFKMTNEFGEWRIARAEILTLAEVGKSGTSKKRR
jgi:hypothetical protein